MLYPFIKFEASAEPCVKIMPLIHSKILLETYARDQNKKLKHIKKELSIEKRNLAFFLLDKGYKESTDPNIFEKNIGIESYIDEYLLITYAKDGKRLSKMEVEEILRSEKAKIEDMDTYVNMYMHSILHQFGYSKKLYILTGKGL